MIKTLRLIWAGRYHLIFLIFLAFFIDRNYFSVSELDRLPASLEETVHLISNLRFNHILGNPSWGMGEEILEADRVYPPVFVLSATLLNRFFGTSRPVVVRINIFYLCVLLLSIYSLGVRMGGRRTGLLACFLFLMFPMTSAMSRLFMLELALAAVVALSIFCLIRCECFTDRKYSLFFGLCCGGGMLTKWTFALYVFIPFLYTALRKSGGRVKSANIGLSFGSGIAVAAPWYFPNLSLLLARAPSGNVRIAAESLPWSSLGGFFFYPTCLIYQMSPLFFVAGVTAVVFFIASEALRAGARSRLRCDFSSAALKARDGAGAAFEDRRAVGGCDPCEGASLNILFFWLLSSYLFLTFLDNKWSHYAFPALPAIALALAIAALKIPRRRLRFFLIGIFCAGGFLQFAHLSSTPYIQEDPWDNFLEIPWTRYNMWDYLKPCEEYVDMVTNVRENLMPILAREIQRRGRVSIGVIAFEPNITPLVEYFLSRENLQTEALIVDFCKVTRHFESWLDQLDMLVTSGNQPFPDRCELENNCKGERLDALLNLDNRDYEKITTLFKKADGVFRVIEAVPDEERYFYVLVKAGEGS